MGLARIHLSEPLQSDAIAQSQTNVMVADERSHTRIYDHIGTSRQPCTLQDKKRINIITAKYRVSLSGQDVSEIYAVLQTPTSRGKPKSGSGDIRIQTAHIFRLMAGKLKPGTLTGNKLVRNRFLDFMTDSLKFISNVNSGTSGAACRAKAYLRRFVSVNQGFSGLASDAFFTSTFSLHMAAIASAVLLTLPLCGS